MVLLSLVFPVGRIFGLRNKKNSCLCLNITYIKFNKNSYLYINKY